MPHLDPFFLPPSDLRSRASLRVLLRLFSSTPNQGFALYRLLGEENFTFPQYKVIEVRNN